MYMNKNGITRMAVLAMISATFVASPLLRASESDDRIETSFKDSYVAKTYLKDDSISTSSKEGVVTLTGTVSAESHKALAEDTASNISGVLRVDNQLQTEKEAKAENADAWMGRKVKLALLFHRNVSASGTEVAVKDGVVTLSGETSTLAQKDLTAAYAKDIDGVVSVVNNLKIVPVAEENTPRSAGQKMDDASVTAQVLAAMKTHRSTSGIDMKVTTREGKVTLTGIAKNAAEKSLVTKLTSDIQGVESVHNEMTVQAASNL
jgi:hyperosmotically inducible protein